MACKSHDVLYAYTGNDAARLCVLRLHSHTPVLPATVTTLSCDEEFYQVVSYLGTAQNLLVWQEIFEPSVLSRRKCSKLNKTATHQPRRC